MADEEKLFYTIGEAAQKLGVKSYVLRYWESVFKKLDPEKSITGQRIYRKQDIQVALTIKRLLYDEKYTTEGAIQKLDEMEKSGELKQITFSESEKESLPAGSGKSVAESPETLPAIPREKVLEVKNLIHSTKTILRKYNLG